MDGRPISVRIAGQSYKVMSSSSEEGDRLTGYANGANSYVVKPVLIDEFSGAVKQLGLYWLMVNVVPDRLIMRNE